jgi:hypothetical protein
MEIAYWGEGVSKGRLERVGHLSNDERKHITIVVVTPGTLVGTIDRKALPDATTVMITPAQSTAHFDYQQVDLLADQTEYELRNVPPGKYELQVYGERIRTGADGFTNKVIQRQTVEVGIGETVTLDLGRPN